MKRSTQFAPALLGAAVLVTTAVMPALAAHEGTTYRANLRQVNDPGAHGTASLSYDDEGDLHVRVETRGLEPGGLHLQHIHGSEDVENRCPNQSDDTNGDGLVDLLEGAPVYGERPGQRSSTTPTRPTCSRPATATSTRSRSTTKRSAPPSGPGPSPRSTSWSTVWTSTTSPVSTGRATSTATV